MIQLIFLRYRGQAHENKTIFGANPADWFNGIIDEVRLTNQALSPSQFLFIIPEPGSATLALLALAGWAWRRGGLPRRS